MSARWRWPTGSAPARATRATSWPVPRTSSSTCSSRAPTTRSARVHRRGPRCGRWRLQRLHHQGVHDLLRPAAGRASPARARHPERHHVGAGAASGRRGRRAQRHPRRDPHARRRAVRPGRRAMAVGRVPRSPAGARHARDRGHRGRSDRPDIRGFFDEHYRPANMVVSVAGDCRHDQVADDIERRFAGTPGGNDPDPHRARPRDRSRCRWCAAPPSRPTWSTACARSPATTSGAGPWPC